MGKHRVDQEIRQSPETGFTLLELLVAVTLIAIMAVGVWNALDLCIRSWIRGIETIDINQRNRSTQDLVRKQIASAYPLISSSAASSSGAQNVARMQNVAIQASTSAPVFSGGETSLRFVSPNSLLSMNSMGLVLVTYEVEVDSDGNMALVEREAPYVGQGVDDGGFISSVPVFFNLKECTFEYYDLGDADNPPEWLTDWDTENRRRLPAAVRISMISRDADTDWPGRQMIIPLRAQYNYLQVQQRSQRQRVQQQRSQQLRSQSIQSVQPKQAPRR